MPERASAARQPLKINVPKRKHTPAASESRQGGCRRPATSPAAMSPSAWYMQ